jgi:hypothetical protein
MAAESFNKGHKVCNRQKEHKAVGRSENLVRWRTSSNKVPIFREGHKNLKKSPKFFKYIIITNLLSAKVKNSGVISMKISVFGRFF